MLLHIKKLVSSLQEEYAVVQCCNRIFVARNLFVIACVIPEGTRKFSIRPVNLFGMVNPYFVRDKYHLLYKDLEEDVIFTIRRTLTSTNISILYR